MSAMSANPVGIYTTPATSQATSQAPSPIATHDMYYYLTEGLGDSVHREYIDNRSFAGAIKSQTNALLARKGGQYVVLSQVTEDQLEVIDNLRNTRYKRLRFMYLNNERVLIFKIMPGVVHELGISEFGRILLEKIAAMGLPDELGDVRGTKYQGVASSKEADSAFKPLSRSLQADWPTIVIECGIPENLERLRAEAHWWLESSAGDVKIVLLFSISEAERTIHIENWELVHAPNQPLTHPHPPSLTTVTKTSEVDLAQPVPAGAVLSLNFAKVFLRPPAVGEGDITFTTPDLDRYAGNIWRRAQ